MLTRAIAKHLDTLGIVSYSDTAVRGTNCFVQHMPDEPDAAVAIMATGGNALGSRLAYDEPNVQILVRGAAHDHATPYGTARSIFSALHCLDLTVLDVGGVDEVFVQSITALQSDPIPLGVDANERQEWSLNFACSTKSPTAHRS